MSDLVPFSPQSLQAPKEKIDTLLRAFFADKDQLTLEAYQAALRQLQEFANEPTMDSLMSRLFSSHLQANLLVIEFKNSLLARLYAANSINLKLTAIRSLIDFANTFGIVPWSLKVTNVPAEKYRDTRGPEREAVFKMIDAAAAHPNKFIATRDTAMLWLMFGRGLRREEVRSIDLSDVDEKRKTVSVKRKKRSEKEALTVSVEIIAAIKQFVVHRGNIAGPLFCAFRGQKRLSGEAIWKIVVAASTKANVGHVYPHKLRHSAINEAFEATDDLRAIQQFSGHRDIKTLMIYDDHRRDAGGDISQKVSSGVKKK